MFVHSFVPLIALVCLLLTFKHLGCHIFPVGWQPPPGFGAGCCWYRHWAGPVCAAGSDEGSEPFSSSLVRHFLQLCPAEGRSLLRRLRGDHQLPPAAALAGATALQQLLQHASPGCAGWRKQLSLYPPASRSHRLASLTFLLAVRWVRPPWPCRSPAPAAAWCSWWTRKSFMAASCIRICTCTMYIPKKAIKFSLFEILRPWSAWTFSVCGKPYLLPLFFLWKISCPGVVACSLLWSFPEQGGVAEAYGSGRATDPGIRRPSRESELARKSL